MAFMSFFGGTSGLKKSEVEIRHTFNLYSKSLFAAKWKITDEITEWSKKLIAQIEEYVTQQRTLLEEEYAKKVTNLNTLRDQFIEQALIYEEKKDTEQINQLLNQCNTLKVELAALVYVDRPISSIQLKTEEQPTQQNVNEYNVHKTEDEQSRKKIAQDYDIDTTESSPSKVTFASIKEKYRRSFITKSYNEKNQSTIYRDDLVEECPICCMSFPSNMASNDRFIHVNEHFTND